MRRNAKIRADFLIVDKFTQNVLVQMGKDVISDLFAHKFPKSVACLMVDYGFSWLDFYDVFGASTNKRKCI